MRTSKYFSDNIILVFSVCVVLSFLCQIFKYPAPVNILYIISLMLVLFCYALDGYYNGITVAMAIFIGLASIANGFRSGEMDYYTHILITICIFICIDVSSDVKISLDTFKKIATMFLITSIILLVAYYFGPLKSTHLEYSDAVTLNMNNPNTAGLWLTCIFILLMYSSFLFTKFKRILYIAVAIGILPIVLATQSRNSFFACVFFVVGVILTKFFKIKRVPKWILVALAVLPLIAFVFYMYVVVKNMDFWGKIFSTDVIDKGLGTRQNVWQSVIDNFRHCFFFGDYYKYYDSQQHNSLLTIFCRFGAPVMVLACVSIYKSLKNLQTKSSFYAMLSLASIFFTGCFEASIFVGIAGMYLMLLLLPACASVESIGITKNN